MYGPYDVETLSRIAPKTTKASGGFVGGVGRDQQPIGGRDIGLPQAMLLLAAAPRESVAPA